MIANPFKYGTIVTGKDFCGRYELLGGIIKHIESAQNIAIIGERRIGKTSLVREAARKTKGIRTLYVDFFGVKSIDAMCKRIIHGITLMERKERWITKIIKAIPYIRPKLLVDPLTGAISLTFDASTELGEESIPGILSLIEKLANEKPLVAVFDEFQAILDINDFHEALGLLRSTIQFQNDVPYIFAGSIRHKMDWIFSSPDSPFFKSAILINVDSLPYDEYSKFLMGKFKRGKRTICDEFMQKIFEMADNVTGDIQQLCEALWEVTPEGAEVRDANIADALSLIFARERNAYENYLSLLTDLQQKCLMAITSEGGKNVLSARIVKAAGAANPSSVRKAVGRMISLNILFEKGKEVRFANPFFRAWLVRRGG